MSLTASPSTVFLTSGAALSSGAVSLTAEFIGCLLKHCLASKSVRPLAFFVNRESCSLRSPLLSIVQEDFLVPGMQPLDF